MNRIKGGVNSYAEMGNDFLRIDLIVLILFWMCVDNEGVIKRD